MFTKLLHAKHAKFHNYSQQGNAQCMLNMQTQVPHNIIAWAHGALLAGPTDDGSTYSNEYVYCLNSITGTSKATYCTHDCHPLRPRALAPR